MIGDNPDTLVDQFVKTGIICRSVDNDGVRPEPLHHLIQSVLESLAVFQFARTPAGRTDGDDALGRNAVEAVPPTFRRSPSDIVDDGDAILPYPIPKGAHTVGIEVLPWRREILISREIRRDRAVKVTENF